MSQDNRQNQLDILKLMNSNDFAPSIKQTLKYNSEKRDELQRLKEQANISPEDRLLNSEREKIIELFSHSLWTTEKIDLYNKLNGSGELEDLGLGNIKAPLYNNEPDTRRAGIDFGYTQNEVEEIRKCANDILYFIDNYAFTLTPRGYELIKLRPYQRRILKLMMENQFIVFCASRQIGKTTMTTMFLLWFALFHHTKNVFVLANKGETMIEIINKIKEIYR